MDAMNVFDQCYSTDDYNSTSEVFAYASKLVQDDLADAIRMFEEPLKTESAAAQELDAMAA
jgi:hypothetical protein